MTPSQKRRFQKLTKDMAALLAELESDHPNVGLFIDDAVPYLIDAGQDDEPKNCVIASGAYWHRSSGGGF